MTLSLRRLPLSILCTAKISRKVTQVSSQIIAPFLCYRQWHYQKRVILLHAEGSMVAWSTYFLPAIVMKCKRAPFCLSFKDAFGCLSELLRIICLISTFLSKCNNVQSVCRSLILSFHQEFSRFKCESGSHSTSFLLLLILFDTLSYRKGFTRYSYERSDPRNRPFWRLLHLPLASIPDSAWKKFHSPLTSWLLCMETIQWNSVYDKFCSPQELSLNQTIKKSCPISNHAGHDIGFTIRSKIIFFYEWPGWPKRKSENTNNFLLSAIVLFYHQASFHCILKSWSRLAVLSSPDHHPIFVFQKFVQMALDALLGRVILLMSDREFLARERALTVAGETPLSFWNAEEEWREAISSMRGSSDMVTAGK